MRYLLGLEAVGDDTHQLLRLHQMVVGGCVSDPGLRRLVSGGPPRSWVAEVTGRCPTYGFAREFMRPLKDYRNANAKGSRGIMLYYHLRPGRIYEVNARQGWSRIERYFCRVQDGCLIRLTRTEVERCLSED